MKQVQMSEDELTFHRRLLGTILHRTIKNSGAPAKWFGADISFVQAAAGGTRIELQLSVLCDEPRLLTYLSALQADFIRRLLAIDESAHNWFAGLVWRLSCDPQSEISVPGEEYWEAVANDRRASAQARGDVSWDRHSLERHFSETKPDDLVVDFSDTEAPQREVKDIYGAA